MSTVAWSRAQLPDLRGKQALVTGAASGLGLEVALGLAARGAQVVLADRNVAGGEAAVQRIRREVADARVEFQALDLADLGRVRAFAAAWTARGQPLDILVNSAGILPPLQRRTTADGFELKFGINVLGHFALSGLLWDALQQSAAARVVWVSSLVHRHARLDFDDLQSQHAYAPQTVYNQAKLACLVLALQLQRQCVAAGAPVIGLAAHPGVARTALGTSRDGQKRRGVIDHLTDFSFWLAMKFFGQAQDRGARPILHAATAVDVQGGEFYGPDGFAEMAGEPVRVKASAPALDAEVGRRLWQACEQLSGVRYPASDLQAQAGT